MNETIQSMIARLKQFGKPELVKNETEVSDYVSLLGLTEADVPALTELAALWADKEWGTDDEEEPGVIFAPVHAWRALAQLRPSLATQRLLAMLDPVMELDDDWLMNDFPDVIALIGSADPTLLSLLEAYLHEDGHNLYSTISVAKALEEYAARNIAARDRVVDILMRKLDAYETNDPTLNGFLISYLVSLNVVEAAERIERLFSEDYVDEFVISWRGVLDGLGVKGIGLMPEPPPRRQRWSMSPPAPAPESMLMPAKEATRPERRQRQESKHKKKISAASRRKNRKKK